VQFVLSSSIDASGALTILVMAIDGGRPFVVALPVKQGVGVRYTWVRRGGSPAELRDLLMTVGNDIDLAPTTADYVRLVVRQFPANQAC